MNLLTTGLIPSRTGHPLQGGMGTNIFIGGDFDFDDYQRFVRAAGVMRRAGFLADADFETCVRNAMVHWVGNTIFYSLSQSLTDPLWAMLRGAPQVFFERSTWEERSRAGGI